MNRVRKPTQKSAAIIRPGTAAEADKAGVCENDEGEPGELVPQQEGKDWDLNWIYFEIL